MASFLPLLPYITPLQDKQVFLLTKVREFVQAAANANNGKDVEIPQGAADDPNNVAGNIFNLHPNTKTVKKSMPVAGIKEANTSIKSDRWQ